MKIQDFAQDLEKQNYEKVYELIQKECIKMFEKLADLKQIEIEKNENEDIDTYLNRIKFRFENQSARFRDVMTLCSLLQEWYFDHSCDVLKMTHLQRLETIINVYNRLEYELEEYLKVEERVKKEGFENLVEKRKKELITLFKEMLEYKNKKYDITWDFERWLDQIFLYYNYYKDYICQVSDCLRHSSVTYDFEAQPVEVNDTEKIIILEEFYETLIFEGDDYKCNAHHYRDFDLEEGQTLRDLKKAEEEKIKNLFKEMLDYLNVEYDSDYFGVLKNLVCEHYPYYESTLRFLTSSYYLMNATYIDMLDSMENFYERAKNEYKNHEANMKEYEKNKKEEDEALEQLIQLENGEILIDDDL